MASTSRSTSAWAARSLLLLAMAAYGASGASMVEKGCFSSSQPLTNQGTDTYQSSGNCQKTCLGMNKPVLGLSDANVCWCGDELPAKSDQVSDSDCSTPCDGYPAESCGGGTSYFTVWLTGSDTDVPYYSGGGSSDGGDGGDDSSPASSSPPETSTTAEPTTTQPAIHTTHKAERPTVITSIAPGTTVVITHAPEATASSSSSATPGASSGDGSSPNVAGIAAGVVVGVVAIIAIAAGIFFWMRHKRRTQAEDEYKRTQVSDFMRGGDKRPPPTGYSNMSDSRLDPEAGNRRDSHGSIRDDQDYSRRILRVANPDNS